MLNQRFHDGALLGVLLEEPDTARFVVRDLKGREFTVSFEKVDQLQLSDFREGNTVFAIYEPKVADIDPGVLGPLLQLSAADVQHPVYRKAIEKIHRGEQVMIQIDSSYGAFGAVLCCCVQVQEGRHLTS